MTPDVAADPNAVTAEWGGSSLPGRITALEGGRGLMRVALPDSAALSPESTLVLEMHDGARFRVTVVETLGAGPQPGQQEFRLKLAGKERGATH